MLGGMMLLLLPLQLLIHARMGVRDAALTQTVPAHRVAIGKLHFSISSTVYAL